ncbi:hypothetical protein MYA_1446 [Burkholderia sp. KJ006]|nr:hypothetical protein MYA_1446 [Burkholderia sp. KJ006]
MVALDVHGLVCFLLVLCWGETAATAAWGGARGTGSGARRYGSLAKCKVAVSPGSSRCRKIFSCRAFVI